jgi:hypothetical protein
MTRCAPHGCTQRDGAAEALLAQVVLQAHPRRRHLGHGGPSHARQIRQPETGLFGSADQKERVAGDDLAKAAQRGVRLAVARLHHPHRAAPGQIDGPVEQRGYRVAGNRGVDKFYVDPFAAIEPERLDGIERRVKYGTEILRKPDLHGRYLTPRWQADIGTVVHLK